MRTRKAAELVLDFDFYPRNNVDSANVTKLVDSLISGAELPPVIIDQKSKRVVDGFHRVRAHTRLYGDEAEIECVEKRYKSDADMFLDAMRYNAAHGYQLDPSDRTHCAILGERLGLDIEAVAGALNMPADKLGDLRNTRTATLGSLTVPLKQTVRHKAGQALTQRQGEANKRLSGMNQVFYVNQIIELIESEMLDTSNAHLMDQLAVLAERLQSVLSAT